MDEYERLKKQKDEIVAKELTALREKLGAGDYVQSLEAERDRYRNALQVIANLADPAWKGRKAFIAEIAAAALREEKRK